MAETRSGLTSSRADMERLRILHVDLDAFFAAVEQRDHPELRGKPVIVGGGGANDRGVVSTASYEARRFGVHSAMPLRTAAALCPDAIFVPVHGRLYQSVSTQVMAILGRFTPLVEPLSIDEAFLDVGGTGALFGSALEIASQIKQAIRNEVQLTASVGVATTKLVAKIASDLRKPDGLVVVEPGGEAAFLAPLPIGRLWGVGEQTAKVLREYGVRTIGDLADLPIDLLVRRMGPHAGTLHERALGIDSDPVAGGEPAKSVSHEHTFDVDTRDQDEIERTLLALSEGVSGRLRAAGLRAGTVAVKIRDSTFRTITRQRTLPEPTDLTEPIWRTALELARPETRGVRIRLLGVAATNFGEREQLQLFEAENPRRRRAVEASDAVRRRFGERAITRARLLGRRLPAPFERDPSSVMDGRRIGAPRPAAADEAPGADLAGSTSGKKPRGAPGKKPPPGAAGETEWLDGDSLEGSEVEADEPEAGEQAVGELDPTDDDPGAAACCLDESGPLGEEAADEVRDVAGEMAGDVARQEQPNSRRAPS